ncbi:MAG TPA: HAMP domain-containing sensor histidine kinase [Burkholderiaceae bacterium]|nr:HAMP domain-containing sensor histidine kinase [Burkholderiaceae bacterium]
MTPPPAHGDAHARWHASHEGFKAKCRRWRRSMRHSLKWRIVIVFLLLALAVTGVFLVGMKRVVEGGWQSYAKPLVADYVDKLAQEIGSPPDVERARAIVARLPVTVRIDGPQVQFDSHPGMHRRWSEYGDDPRYGPESWGLVRNTADGHRITFGLTGPLHATQPRLFGWFTLAALLGLTLAAYAYVRRMLRPLQAIGEGVARFGAGDFAQPIREVRNDELGDLAERINRMAASLQGMLDAKRALLLAISHELRSPLTRARVNAELVGDGEHRDALLRDLSEMRDLITDLLESERLATGHAALQTERIALPALVREVMATQFADATLTLELDASIGPVQADPMRLKLLLRNLIDNAVRHSAGAAQPPVVSLQRAPDGRVALAVRDFGPGVSDEQLQRLAEPFYRTDSARTRAAGGVGLGLYLCRLVAQAHGGELRLRRAEPGLEATVLLAG